MVCQLDVGVMHVFGVSQFGETHDHGARKKHNNQGEPGFEPTITGFWHA